MASLDQEFENAFQKISGMNEAVAPDEMLKLYAYYKQATFGNNFVKDYSRDVRSAFKFNAWMQLKDMSAEDAKREYIKLANEILIKTNTNDD